MPFAKVQEVPAHFGVRVGGEADYEVYTLESATVANVGIIVGNEVDGVRGVVFRTRFDQALRLDLVFNAGNFVRFDGLLREVQVARAQIGPGISIRAAWGA